MGNHFVAILMGSNSDLTKLQATIDILNKFEVSVEVNVLSAHRTPEATQAYVKKAESRGCQVFIAAAGLAAHLAGAVAAQTVLPVIGIPIDAGPLQGLDALLSTVQMPGGIPVATVAIGSAGAKNAAYLALQIMGTQNAALQTKLRQEREDNAKAILQKQSQA